MPIGALGLGAISMIPALAQSIFGGIQASKANKQFNKLLANRPQYEIPQEYKNILAQYQQARAGNMPGYEQTLGQIGQLGARTRGAAERGAISSTAYGSRVSDIYQKELDALQNLGIQQEQYKTSMLDKVAGAQAGLGEQRTQQWNLNQYLPWQTEMNRYGEMQKGGMENIFGAMQGMTSGLTDLAGTKYYTDALKGLYGNNGGNGQTNPLAKLFQTIQNKAIMGR